MDCIHFGFLRELTRNEIQECDVESTEVHTVHCGFAINNDKLL